jgi:chromosome segregation ATPase
MAVGVDTNDGRSITRDYTMRRESVKQSTTFVGFPEEFKVAPHLVDPTEALALVADVGYIFGRATLTDLTLDKVMATVVACLKNIKVETNDENSEAAINGLTTKIGQMKTFVGEPATVQEFISAVVETVGADLKLANQNVVRLQKTLEGMAQLAVEQSAQADAESRLERARTDLDSANAEVTRLTEVGRQAAAALEEAKNLAATAVDQTEIDHQIEQHVWSIKNLREIAPPAEQPVLAKQKTGRPSYAEAEKGVKQLTATLNDARTTEAMAQAEHDRLVKELADTEGATVCSKCRQSIEEIVKPVIARLKREVKTALNSLNLAKESTAEAVKQLAAGQAVLDRDLEAIAQYDQAERDLRDQHDKALRLWNKASGEYNETQADIAHQTDKITKLRQQTGQGAIDAKAKLPALTTALETARADYRQASAKAEALKTTVQTVGQECRELIAERSRAQERAKTIAEHSKFKAQADVLKQADKLMEDLQRQFVAQAVGPILTRANDFCDGLLRLPLTIKDGQLGMQANTGFISNRSFSDSEKLMAYAAICLALAVESDFKLAVIGRFESFDYEKKPCMAARAIDLVRSGKLHQVLFIEVQSREGGPRSMYPDDLFDCPEFSVVVI